MPFTFRRLLLAFACLVFLPNSLVAGDLARPKAVIDRDGSGRIRMAITIAKLSTSDLGTLEIKPNDSGTAQNALIKYLDICVVTGSTECGDSALKAAYYQNPSLDKTPLANQSTTVTAEIIGGSVATNQDVTDGTWTLTAQILLATSDSSAPFSSSTKISVKFVYGTSNQTEQETGISVAYSLGVRQLPEGTYTVSSKHSLTGVWSQLSSVTLSDGSDGASTGMLAILVPQSFIDASQAIPTRSYQSDFTKQTSSADGSCTISLNDTASSCSLTCLDSGDQTIHPDDLTDLESSGVKSSTSLSDNAVSFSELDSASSYAIVLQYLPDGLSRSCIYGKPSDGITLVELGTGKEPKIGSPSCFIATAAYGSSLDPHLTSLRWFRDQILLSHPTGRNLVRFYYEFGPHAADLIREHPTLKALARAVLWPIVFGIEAWRDGSAKWLLLLAFLPIGLVALRRKKVGV